MTISDGTDSAGSDPAAPPAANEVFQFLNAFREAASPPAVAQPSPTDAPSPTDLPSSTGPSAETDPWEPPAPPAIPPASARPVPAPDPAPLTVASRPRPADQPPPFTTTVWTPTPVPSAETAPDRRRGRLVERVIMAAVLIVSVLAVALIAVHNNQSATKWRGLDTAQIQISRKAAQQVQTANANIGTLNGEVKSLNSQVSSMQAQLSSVANQKEKAIDQTTVYAQLLSAAGQVAQDLQSCIADTNQLYNDLVTSSASDLQSLENEAEGVDATCGQAETDNSILQSAIQSASSTPVS